MKDEYAALVTGHSHRHGFSALADSGPLNRRNCSASRVDPVLLELCPAITIQLTERVITKGSTYGQTTQTLLSEIDGLHPAGADRPWAGGVYGAPAYPRAAR